MTHLATPRRRALALVLGLTLTTGSSACSSSGSTAVASPTIAAASTAPANGAELDATSFAAALLRPGTIVLDVRTPQEYAGGHLAGARNLDVNAPDFRTRLGTLERNAPYAVYCRSGNRSTTALETMRQMGFTAAYHLGGGIGAWTAAGLPVVTG